MKTTTLVLALAFVGAALLAAAPAVEAKAICTNAAEIDDDCRALVCYNHFCSRDLNPVCVTEPCPAPIP